MPLTVKGKTARRPDPATTSPGTTSSSKPHEEEKSDLAIQRTSWRARPSGAGEEPRVTCGITSLVDREAQELANPRALGLTLPRGPAEDASIRS